MTEFKTPQNSFNFNIIKSLLNSYNEKLEENLSDLIYTKTENPSDNIKDFSNKFLKEYNTANYIQYSHLYFLRLKLLKNNLMEISKKKWTNQKICKNILEAKENVIIT